MDFGLSWLHDTNTVFGKYVRLTAHQNENQDAFRCSLSSGQLNGYMVLRSKYKFSAFPILPQPPECHRLQKRMGNATEKKTETKRNEMANE